MNITVYGFSITKESMEKAIFPGFYTVETNPRTGRSFYVVLCGSETITNQIPEGVNADIAILQLSAMLSFEGERIRNYPIGAHPQKSHP